jgi:hypothetical protein
MTTDLEPQATEVLDGLDTSIVFHYTEEMAKEYTDWAKQRKHELIDAFRTVQENPRRY